MGWLKDRRERKAAKAAAAQTGVRPTLPKAPPPPPPPPKVTATTAHGVARPAWMVEGTTMRLYTGHEDLEVVGESNYQDHLARLAGSPRERVRIPVPALLVAEEGNPYDSNAVSVWVFGERVGYLSRKDAAEVRPGLIKLVEQNGEPVALEGVVVGGGLRDDGRLGMYGVWLSWDPADFGVFRRTSAQSFRTGLDSAVAGDLLDDTYDLSWLDDLPEDPTPRMAMLRELLLREQDPISRHYVFVHLERDLYANREAIPGALEEWDQVIVRHDAEMEAIRAALVAKFGSVPLLETYKQACIRYAKGSYDLDAALWWAQRGRALYGADAHKEEWTLDLDKRMAVVQQRIDRRDGRKSAATRGGQASADAVEEELVCQSCGKTFVRVRTRGRKPLNCPECRG